MSTMPPGAGSGPLHDPERLVDANTSLLDRQVVDLDDEPVCKVDDLELVCGEDGAWRVAAILVGPGALGPRIGGRLGATLTGIHRRMRGLAAPQPPSIPWALVARFGSDVRLRAPRSALDPNLVPLEDWLRVHVVDRIPGSRHESG